MRWRSYGLLVLAACTPVVVPDPVGGQGVCVLDETTGRLSVFSGSTGGDEAPVAVFTSTTRGWAPQAVAVDPTADRLFVLDALDRSVLAFPRTASGSAEPLATARFDNKPERLQFDPVRGTLMVSSVRPYGHGFTAGDHFELERDLSAQRARFSFTDGIVAALGIGLDDDGGRIFAPSLGNVDAYDRETGAALGTWASPGSLFFQELVMATAAQGSSRQELLAWSPASFSAFALGAPAGSAALREWSVSPTVDFSLGLVDGARDELLLLTDDAVKAVPIGQTGVVSVVRSIGGSATGLVSPTGFALDLSHRELVVSNPHDQSVVTFDADADGDVAPLRRLGVPAGREVFLGSYDFAFDAPATAGLPGLLVIAARGEHLFTFAPGAPGALTPSADVGLPASVVTLAVDAQFIYLTYANGHSVAVSRALPPLQEQYTLQSVDLSVRRVIPRGQEVVVVTMNGVATLDVPGFTLQRKVAGLQNPTDAAFDDAHGELFVIDGNRVLTFAADADGEVQPLRTLEVPAAARRLLYDPERDQLDVLTPTSVLSFARTATGAATPRRRLVGARSGLQGAVSFAPCAMAP